MEKLMTQIQHWNRAHLIACFGTAQLVARSTGEMELRGGTPENRTEATEWISMFMHEAVLAPASNEGA
jgi:hypothetical protein